VHYVSRNAARVTPQATGCPRAQKGGVLRSREMRSRIIGRGALGAMVLAAAAGSVLGAAPEAGAADGRIVFRAGERVGDVRSIGGDGTQPRLLVRRAENAALSRDGRRLLYLDVAKGSSFLADGNAGNARRAPQGVGGDEAFSPAWSPSGNSIAMIADFFDPPSAKGNFKSLTVANSINGSRRRTLLRLPGSGSVGPHLDRGGASWAPDGHAIAVAVEGENEADPIDIWVARSDGSGARNFTRTPTTHLRIPCQPGDRECRQDAQGYYKDGGCDPRGATETGPIWTPVGIVVTREVCDSTSPSYGRKTLTLLDAKGQPKRKLVDLGTLQPESHGCGGSLSPDRRKIVYVNGLSLFVVPLTGGPPRRLASTDCAYPPSWGRR
jgi:hypothetical protein